MLAVFTLLMIALALTSGSVEASSATVGCIASRALSRKAATLLSALSNFAGVVIMAIFRPAVAQTLFGMASFTGERSQVLTSLCCALFVAVLWSLCASLAGIPTSEGHALISAVSGSALAVNMSLDVFCTDEWLSVLVGLLISTLPLVAFSSLLYLVFSLTFSTADRRDGIRYFKRVQILGSLSGSFLHGAQDSQKFLGIYLFGLSLMGYPISQSDFHIPLLLSLLCAFFMSIGCLIGGRRIVKKIGCNMLVPNALEGSTADTAASAFLGVCSFFGIPISRTHAKISALIGVALSGNGKFKLPPALELFSAWIITFPVCAASSFLLTLLAKSLFF